MKKEFIGFYQPTKKEISDAWKSGVFAFDANALLNLYRYSEATRNDFLRALNEIKNRLFLPHQAALEFHSNRISVIEGVDSSYSKLQNAFKENFEKSIQPELNKYKKHPSIRLENIIKLYEEFQSKLSKELKEQRSDHPDFENDNEVLEKLTDLFEQSIGQEFSKDELNKIYSEGKNRYADKIPPGYKDEESKKKRGDRHVFGDLIIWKELIANCKKQNKPFVFVTDDRKDDWWTIENGKTIRPREELIKEFFDLTGTRILIYNADSFLQYAKENKLLPKVLKKTIEEVREVRTSDEYNHKFLSDYLNTSSESFINPARSLSDLASAASFVNPAQSLSDLMKASSYNPAQSLSDLASSASLIPLEDKDDKYATKEKTVPKKKKSAKTSKKKKE